jgi:hypothetical protein
LKIFEPELKKVIIFRHKMDEVRGIIITGCAVLNRTYSYSSSEDSLNESFSLPFPLRNSGAKQRGRKLGFITKNIKTIKKERHGVIEMIPHKNWL